MKITFRQIDAFRTVMISGSVTESAVMLGISQPAVSRLVMDLEEQLSFKLFRRVGRALAPTEEAQLLMEEFSRALSGLERIKEAAGAIRNFRHAKIGIITTPTFSNAIAPGLIVRFAARCPEAAVTLEVQSSDDAVEWMVSQNFDFGITHEKVSTPQMNTLRLTQGNALCIVPDGHRLADRDEIVPKDLADESFISYRFGSQYRYAIDEVFRDHAITRRIQYEARTTDGICRFVAAGLGVSVIGTIDAPRAMIEGCRLLKFSPSVPFSALLIWSKSKQLSAAAQEFMAAVREVYPRAHAGISRASSE